MSFLSSHGGSSAFTNLYGTNSNSALLTSIPATSPTAPLGGGLGGGLGLPNGFQPIAPTLQSNGLDSFQAPRMGQENSSLPPPSTGPPSKGRKKNALDPFDPKASVPLPHQLEDQFGPFTTTVWKRNERERYRVKQVNEGYETLRVHLPLADGDRRISKVDTLRLAQRYMRHLNELVHSPDHMLRCRCFERFREESEGNVAVQLSAMGDRIRYH